MIKMLKLKRLLLLLTIVLFIAISSCTKRKNSIVTDNVVDTVTKNINDTVVNIHHIIDTGLETPIKSLITQDIQVDTATIYNGGSFEIGSEFYASDSGVITQLGLFSPEKNMPFTVSLWDFDSQVLLTSVNIICTDSLHFTYANITPVNITPNKNYLVSYNNTSSGTSYSYYISQLKTFNNLAYPFSAGSITFINSYYLFATTSTFPTDSGPFFLAPVDFVFQVK